MERVDDLGVDVAAYVTCVVVYSYAVYLAIAGRVGS